MIWFILFLLFLSVIANMIFIYYLYKFIKIIFLFEDDISDTIKALDDVETSIKNVDSLKMFFDDIQIKRLVSEVMDTVKMARFNVNKMSKKLTERSKQKYIIVQEIEESENTFNETVIKEGGTILEVSKNV